MKSLVKNAADEEQVRRAENKILNGRDREIKDLQEVLSTQCGRRLIFRLLTHCKTFETIWEQSARIHYNAGIQDVGHFIMAEVVAADETALLTMMTENKKERDS